MRFDKWPRGFDKSAGCTASRGARGRPQRSIRAYLSSGLAIIAIGVAGTSVGVAGTSVAAAARVLNVRDEGHLRFITSNGSEIIDEGAAKGTIPGNVRVHFVYNGEPTVSARFTIESHAGSISGKAKGNLSNLTSPEPSFRGKFSVTGGSGRYAHIRGSGELFGVFIRRGPHKYALTVQTIGKLPY
jgi:hypothetical protein